MKKRIFFIAFILFVLLLFVFRVELLQAVGNFLIYENPMEPVPALFVLSGDAWDRGNEAVSLYQKGFVDKIICTGENIPRLFLITGVEYLESELTRLHIISLGVPDEKVKLIRQGTSTKEEANVILDYCKDNNLHKAAVLSSKFHTRRIKRTFKEPLEQAGIQLIIRGAPSSAYDEDAWWKSESGLIFVNNEYIKIIYYWLKF